MCIFCFVLFKVKDAKSYMSANGKDWVLRKTTKLMKYELKVLCGYNPKRQMKGLYVSKVESMLSDLKAERWAGYKLMNSLLFSLFPPSFFPFSSFLPFLLSFFPMCEVKLGVQNKRKRGPVIRVEWRKCVRGEARTFLRRKQD